MVKKIGVALAIVIIGLVGVIAVQPSTFRIERSQTIDAPAWIVFNLINNFHRWPTWSPWEKLDPDMQREHGGPEAGVGATYAWSGNDEVGKGRMTIIESELAKKIGIQLEFIEPWEATNTTLFSIAQAGRTVEVTWAMEGHNNFMAKAASLFMDMDELVGQDFEKGLAEMQTVAEREAKEVAKAQAEKERLAAEAAAARKAADEQSETAEAPEEARRLLE